MTNTTMTYVSLDFETDLITAENPAPAPVCLAFADGLEMDLLGGTEEGLENARAKLTELLASNEAILLGHNMAFDMTVAATHWPELALPIMEAYQGGRIHCTLVREKLTNIALDRNFDGQRYGLEALVKLHKLGEYSVDEKHGDAAWRQNYGTLAGQPVEDWPMEAVDYCFKDVAFTLQLYKLQTERAARHGVPLDDAVRQAGYDYALRLITLSGIHTDGERVAALEKHLNQERAKFIYPLVKCEWLVPASRNIKANPKDYPPAPSEDDLLKMEPGTTWQGVDDKGFLCAFEFLGGKTNKIKKKRVKEVYYKRQLTKIKADIARKITSPYLTPKGDVSTKAEHLEEYQGQFDHIDNWLGMQSLGKTLETYVPALKQGTLDSGVPVRPQFQVLMNTGRTSCRAPNLQNMPRTGDVRGCFVARPGHVFINADYDAQEMRTWAQVTTSLFQRPSRLASLYQEDRGFDPHTWMAAESLLSCSYEEAMQRLADGDEEVKAARQASKIVNFGLPGGLGTNGLVHYAKGYGVEWTDEYAEELRNKWLTTWPEAGPYLNWASVKTKGKAPRITQLFVERVRGGCTFTSAANTMFQGLAADCSKLALWITWRAIYGLEDPVPHLRNCKVVNFIHDELMLECPEEEAPDAAEDLVKVMEFSQNQLTPNVPASAGYKINKYWEK